MKLLTNSELRSLWFKFWTAKKHKVIKSSSLISRDDSLMWINSGVAALKPYFLGSKIPPFSRLVNIQKTVRTNDLQQIGQTNRHLSFFEMMGNFSFADYKKESAIIWAWEFLTDSKWLAINPERLVVVYFREDLESFKILQKISKLNSKQIVAGDRETNFWNLGVGPCGPNLEFFYDFGQILDPKNQALTLLKNNIENNRYLEIWNVVFSEFLAVGDNKFQPLPSKNIDTGAGFERLLMLSQKCENPFQTDIFTPARNQLAKILQKKSIFFEAKPISSDQKIFNRRCQIIIDHSRTAVFLLTDLLEDGQNYEFSEKRGSIIRKMIRTATLELIFLKIKKPQLSQMVSPVIMSMGDVYPNLKKYADKVCELINFEEKKFRQLLIQPMIQQLFLVPPTKLSAKNMMIFVTSSGIPLSFLQKIAEKLTIQLDLVGFKKLWKEHQKISSKKIEKWAKSFAFLQDPNYSQQTKFIENKPKITTIIRAIFHNGKPVQSASGQAVWFIVEKTPFYPERGGQTADQGTIKLANFHSIIEVQQNNYQQTLHYLENCSLLTVNSEVTLEINAQRRTLSCKNHSATHLLQAICRNEINNKIYQIGSFNSPDYLRLDLFFPLKPHWKMIWEIEQKFIALIKSAISTKINFSTLTVAIENKALALFSEKMNPNAIVRVVSFADYSAEVCGGTHVKSTIDIEKFIITKFEKINNQKYRFYALTSYKTCENFQKKTIKNLLNLTKEFAHLLTFHENLYWKYKDLLQKSSAGHTAIGEIAAETIILREKIITAGKKFAANKMLQLIEKESVFKAINIPNFAFPIFQKIVGTDLAKYGIPGLLKLAEKMVNSNNFILLFAIVNPKKFIFIIFDSTLTDSFSWSDFLKKKRGNQIKSGGPNHRIQGVVTNISISDFWKIIFNQLTIVVKK